MSYKGDVKPVTLTSNGVFFTGRTRVRGIMAQPTTPGSTGSGVINTLVNATTASATTTNNYYIPIIVGTNAIETIYLPEDGVLYENGVGCTSISNMTITLFIDK
jgi:hypothetical protein